ncbi:neuronal pentraxin-2-like, partial [Xenia sp. Carnegie-2017]|uniref:neuronal pentraxin-2-like n=1 Tax=Xenia sp. Carnegie-2017 TaxID=2897299 RepID=UPI001F045765
LLTRTGVNLADGKLHHVCVTWKSSSGIFAVYKNGQFEKSLQNINKDEEIEANGTWVIGQDQDTGSTFAFQKEDSFKGDLTEMNVWDRVLTDYEIQRVAKDCGTLIQGNVIKYSDFKMSEETKFIERLSCCPAS